MIKKMMASDMIYARFLNTLSLMEYTGARKIIKSQPQQHIHKKILDHMAEEMRHAQVLKRAAMKVAPGVCDTYEPDTLFCGVEAYQYFQTVDHAAKQALNVRDPWQCYLYTTFLIEIRVLMFYAAFEKALLESGKPSVFRSILAEEKNHLEEVSGWLSEIPDYEKNKETLKKIEEEAFEKFLLAIKYHLDKT